MAIAPLGIDNIFFSVIDLAEAIGFYERCGLTLDFQIAERGMALFSIGEEAPGLLLQVGQKKPARLWLVVADAKAVALALAAEGFETKQLETATGLTVEVTDPSGNVLGFADHTRRPDLAGRR